MTGFTEHNNRAKAKQYAEYITGKELRLLVASKVHEYAGPVVSVFDGAAGSGQLEQFINLSGFSAIDIQSEACEALAANFTNAKIQNRSFFLCDIPSLCDCAVMNPPFSIKFKNLSEEEQEAIQEQFPWKKSGVVDDIFILRALNFVGRFGFFIVFPGVSYRASEKKMREIIGARLAELLLVEKAFEDTQINVLFLVIDKQKTEKEVKTAIYNCADKQYRSQSSFFLNEDFAWEMPRDVIEEEVIDITSVNDDLNKITVKNLGNHLDIQIMTIQYFNYETNYLKLIEDIRDVCNFYEKKYFEVFGIKKSLKSKEKEIEQLDMFPKTSAQQGMMNGRGAAE